MALTKLQREKNREKLKAQFDLLKKAQEAEDDIADQIDPDNTSYFGKQPPKDQIGIYKAYAQIIWSISGDEPKTSDIGPLMIDGPKQFDDIMMLKLYSNLYKEIKQYISVPNARLHEVVSISAQDPNGSPIDLEEDILRRKFDLKEDSNQTSFSGVKTMHSAQNIPEKKERRNKSLSIAQIIADRCVTSCCSYPQKQHDNYFIDSSINCVLRAFQQWYECMAEIKPQNAFLKRIKTKLTADYFATLLNLPTIDEGITSEQIVKILAPSLQVSVHVVNSESLSHLGSYKHPKRTLGAILLVQTGHHVYYAPITYNATKFKSIDDYKINLHEYLNKLSYNFESSVAHDLQVGLGVRSIQGSPICKYCHQRCKGKLHQQHEDTCKYRLDQKYFYVDYATISNLLGSRQFYDYMNNLIGDHTDQKLRYGIVLVPDNKTIQHNNIIKILKGHPLTDPRVTNTKIEGRYLDGTTRIDLGLNKEIQFVVTPIDTKALMELESAGFRGLPSANNIASWLRKTRCVDMRKSVMFHHPFDFFIKTPPPSFKPLRGLPSKSTLPDGFDISKIDSNQVYYIDIIRCYITILYGLDWLKCAWPIYNVTDQIEPYDGHDIKDHTGFYHITFSDDIKLPMFAKESGWWFTGVLLYLKELNIQFKINAQYIAANRLPYNYFRRLVDTIFQSCPNSAKNIINPFMGMLAIRERAKHSDNQLVTSLTALDDMKISETTIVLRHDLLPFDQDGNGLSWGQRFYGTEEVHHTDKMINAAIVQMANILLYKTHQNVGGTVLYFNTDAIVIYKPDNPPDDYRQIEKFNRPTGHTVEQTWLHTTPTNSQKTNWEHIVDEYTKCV